MQTLQNKIWKTIKTINAIYPEKIFAHKKNQKFCFILQLHNVPSQRFANECDIF